MVLSECFRNEDTSEDWIFYFGYRKSYQYIWNNVLSS